MVSIALRGLFGPYEYKQYNEETKQDEIIKEPGISTREVILYTAIFSGISYGIGWLGGNFFNVLRLYSILVDGKEASPNLWYIKITSAPTCFGNKIRKNKNSNAYDFIMLYFFIFLKNKLWIIELIHLNLGLNNN